VSPDLSHLFLHASGFAEDLFSVVQIFNLPYRWRIAEFYSAKRETDSTRRRFPKAGRCNSAIQRNAAKPQPSGARLWSKTQPQRVGIAAALRLVLRTQPRSEKSSRLAPILSDTDRLQVCATSLATALRGYLPEVADRPKSGQACYGSVTEAEARAAAGALQSPQEWLVEVACQFGISRLSVISAWRRQGHGTAAARNKTEGLVNEFCPNGAAARHVSRRTVSSSFLPSGEPGRW
jgi:hypothetical protein